MLTTCDLKLVSVQRGKSVDRKPLAPRTRQGENRMRFKSIQLKIAVLSGVCVLAATAGLVAYGIVSAGNARAFVASQVTTLTDV